MSTSLEYTLSCFSISEVTNNGISVNVFETLHLKALRLATMTCAHSLSHIITVGPPTTTVIYYRCRRGPLTVGGPGSLNLLNLLLLRHCINANKIRATAAR